MKKKEKEACFRCGGAQCTRLKNLFKMVVCDWISVLVRPVVAWSSLGPKTGSLMKFGLKLCEKRKFEKSAWNEKKEKFHCCGILWTRLKILFKKVVCNRTSLLVLPFAWSSLGPKTVHEILWKEKALKIYMKWKKRKKEACFHLPSQSAPTILVLKTWVGLQPLPLLFNWITMALVFAPWFLHPIS